MRAVWLAVLSSLVLSLSASADLVVTLERDAADPFRFRGQLANDGDLAVAPVLRFTVSPALTLRVYELNGWTCAFATGEVTCRKDIFTEAERHSFLLDVSRAGAGAGHYTVAAEIRSASTLARRAEASLTVGHSFDLGSFADSGAGSFRAAILAANANCTGDLPCSILINFHTEIGPKTFELATPLPPITACELSIFAPRRPPDLSDVKHSVPFGLQLRPACDGSRISINGLAITNTGDAVTITGNARATYDLTRLTLSAGARGVFIDAPNADVTINDGFVSSGRTAVSINAARSTTITKTTLGPTHASGVFAGPNAGSVVLLDSLVTDNDHFGLALVPGTTVRMAGTTFSGNDAMDIDWSLDGPGAPSSVPTTPVITSAIYDTTRNLTRITIDVQAAGIVDVFTSHALTMFATAELQQLAGSTVATGPGTLTIEAGGDLRGSFVSAIRHETTRLSEPSAALEVR